MAVHNWLITTEVGYLIVDFQDEKDICKTVLEELLQLRKRLRIPFLFAGLMERPRKYLTSYAYNEYPFFDTPEEAVALLLGGTPIAIKQNLTKIKFGENIPCVRPRQLRTDIGEVDEETEDELDEAANDL